MTAVARTAEPEDVPEIVRLVGAMYADMAEEYAGMRSLADPEWARAAASGLLDRLGDDVMAFVVDHPSNSGEVVAVAVGRLQSTLPSPRRRGTIAGYVEWVATDSRVRRNGFARVAVVQLLNWFEERGAGVVDLHASSAATPLYRELGFEGGGPVSLSLRF